MKKFLQLLPLKFVIPLFLLSGIAVGLFAYITYVGRLHSYATDDPSACVNCHIMSPYYQSWQNSSHGVHTNCNDCHVPQTSFLAKYTFKAIDGLYHSAVFTLRAEPEVIFPRKSSSNVIMSNCIRCHTQLNNEFIKLGMNKYTDTLNGNGKACWDCHRNTPHTRVNSINSAPNVIAPMPKSPIPTWIKSK